MSRNDQVTVKTHFKLSIFIQLYVAALEQETSPGSQACTGSGSNSRAFAPTNHSAAHSSNSGADDRFRAQECPSTGNRALPLCNCVLDTVRQGDRVDERL